MAYKSLSFIIPLILTSMVTLPDGIDFPNKVSPSMSKISIDSDPFASSTPSGSDYFYCDAYGPFPCPSSSDKPISFTYQLYSISSQYIIERMRVFSVSNTVLSASSKEEIYYFRGNQNTVSFTLPLKDYFTKDGLQVKFEILNASTREILHTYSSTFYPSSNAFISGSSLKQSIYTSKSLGFYGANLELNEIHETFNFTHFGDYLDIDNYYRLDISKTTFLYPNSYTFNYAYAYICFNDDERLFPYYTHQSNGDIMIPIRLTRIGDTIHFAFNRTFYINKRTLQISDTYRSGFITTTDFYLPVNGRKSFNGKKLYFELSGMGLDNISTSISINYDTSKSYVGLCTDGDYCVVGGKR